MIGSAQPEPPALEIIRTGTRLRPVPLVPQIRLYQAGDPISLWQRTELAAGRTGLDPPFWAFAWAVGLSPQSGDSGVAQPDGGAECVDPNGAAGEV